MAAAGDLPSRAALPAAVQLLAVDGTMNIIQSMPSADSNHDLTPEGYAPEACLARCFGAATPSPTLAFPPGLRRRACSQACESSMFANGLARGVVSLIVRTHVRCV